MELGIPALNMKGSDDFPFISLLQQDVYLLTHSLHGAGHYLKS
jgi:hypothetical protein